MKRQKRYQSRLIRKETYSIEEIREATRNTLFIEDDKESMINLDGDLVRGNSHRYQTFFKKGIKCVRCGLEGQYFAKERGDRDARYHLNLYAVNAKGEEVLMTKDHIIPRSKGGANNLSNYQPMCVNCNVQKGNKIL